MADEEARITSARRAWRGRKKKWNVGPFGREVAWRVGSVSLPTIILPADASIGYVYPC